MIYIEPEMEVIKFGRVGTSNVIDGGSIDNGGGGSTPPDPDVDFTW